MMNRTDNLRHPPILEKNMSSTVDSPASRRQFMKTTAVAAAATLVPGITSPLFAAEKDPYAGFRMGIQSYTLRGFDVTKALETTDKLGLHYWEAYPNHIPVSTVPAQVAKYKKMLDAANVKLIAFGVLPFSKDETQARAFFDFAKAIGVETLANPEKNKATFDLLDKLVEEYAINIAIATTTVPVRNTTRSTTWWRSLKGEIPAWEPASTQGISCGAMKTPWKPSIV